MGNIYIYLQIFVKSFLLRLKKQRWAHDIPGLQNFTDALCCNGHVPQSCLVLVYLVEDFPWILILNQKLTSPNSYFPFYRAVFKYYILLTFQSPRESLISFISMEKLGKFTNSVIFNSFKPKSVTDKIYSSRNNAAKEYEEINNPRYVFCWGYNRNNNSSTSKVANFSLAIVSTKQNV